MNRKRALTVGILILLVGGAVAAWPYVFEAVEETVVGDYEGEAVKNPLFALQEMLRRLEIPTRTEPLLDELPPADHALVLASPGWGYGAGDVDRLLAWVEEGGHLVVTPSELDEEDPLLNAVDIWGFYQGDWDSEAEGAEPAATAEGELSESADPEPDVLEAAEPSAGDGEAIEIPASAFASDRRPWIFLYHGGEGEVLRADGPLEAAWMLTLGVGQGALTALADGTILTNDQLAEKDHALIAWHAIVLGEDPPAGVLLIHGDIRPSIWALMTDRAWPIGLSLIVLVLAALVNFSRRIGPKVEDPDHERRHLEEHVSAVGRFFWRRGLEDVLIRSTRRALGKRLGQGRELVKTELQEQAMSAAARIGLDSKLVREALVTGEVRDRQRYLRIINTLETLRRAS